MTLSSENFFHLNLVSIIFFYIKETISYRPLNVYMNGTPTYCYSNKSPGFFFFRNLTLNFGHILDTIIGRGMSFMI